MKRLVWILLLALAGITPIRADFNDGVVAYLMGEYDKAYATMRSLAETADHGFAQYYLGMMHLRGQGTPQDDEQASHWFRKAAEHGIPQAQSKLAGMYMEGRGVPQDYEFAYVWYKVSAAHKHKDAEVGAEQAKQHLTPEQLSEADKLAAEYIQKYGPKEGEEGKPIQIPAK